MWRIHQSPELIQAMEVTWTKTARDILQDVIDIAGVNQRASIIC
jgi:hypothetical protein